MPLGLNIASWIHMNHPTVDDLTNTNALGIELEYESVTDLAGWVPQHWTVASDGSLRHRGVELVSRPLLFANVEDALLEAETMVLTTGAIASERCGLHTHMNMRPYSIGQVWALSCLYAIIEPTLYQTYAVQRKDSMFAVPLWLNTRQVSALYRDITALRNFRSAGPMPVCTILNSCKYSALNFTSLASFGTLEMRQPYCTTDFEAIRSWVDFCIRLVEIGTSWEDPNEVLDYYERGSLEEIQERMFGETVAVDPDDQELADDAAALIAGQVDPVWQDLSWER